MTEEQELFIAIGQGLLDTVQSQMFGKPCFKINGRAFVCFFQNEMVFKLCDETHADALSLDASQLFDPSGKKRPMKEWVQVPYQYKDSWLLFAQSAKEYVGSIEK